MELKAIADTVNGIFEAGGTVTGLINLLALRRDKKVQGVHWSPYLWYTSWGLWNLVFYPIYGAWLSFLGGIGVVTMNSLWLAHVYYYWQQHLHSIIDTSSTGGEPMEMRKFDANRQERDHQGSSEDRDNQIGHFGTGSGEGVLYELPTRREWITTIK